MFWTWAAEAGSGDPFFGASAPEKGRRAVDKCLDLVWEEGPSYSVHQRVGPPGGLWNQRLSSHTAGMASCQTAALS